MGARKRGRRLGFAEGKRTTSPTSGLKADLGRRASGPPRQCTCWRFFPWRSFSVLRDARMASGPTTSAGSSSTSSTSPRPDDHFLPCRRPALRPSRPTAPWPRSSNAYSQVHEALPRYALDPTEPGVLGNVTRMALESDLVFTGEVVRARRRDRLAGTGGDLEGQPAFRHPDCISMQGRDLQLSLLSCERLGRGRRTPRLRPHLRLRSSARRFLPEGQIPGLPAL